MEAASLFPVDDEDIEFCQLWTEKMVWSGDTVVVVVVVVRSFG